LKLFGVARTAGRIIERAASLISRIGSGVLAVLMFFTAVDVALRYFFNSPIPGGYEISSFMMAIVIPSGLALCALRKGHINVDVLTMRLPQRIQAALGYFADLTTLGILCFIIWQSVKYSSLLYESNTQAAGVPVPHYPFVIVVTICFIVFALVVIRNLIDSIRHSAHGAKSGGEE